MEFFVILVVKSCGVLDAPLITNKKGVPTKILFDDNEMKYKLNWYTKDSF